jgi:hypothetical protein
MRSQTEPDNPGDSGAASFPGTSTTPACIEDPEELHTIMEEHDLDMVVDASGHPVRVFCSCGWTGGVLGP